MAKTLNALDLSKQLIACNSVTPLDNGALDVLTDALTPLGFECHKLGFEEKGCAPVDNLFALRGEGKHLCFAGHTDVVPPGEETLWTSPPFSPEIRNGMLFGRGASDMKCAIACFAAAVSELIAGGASLGKISFLITGDEEAEAVNGTKKVLNWLNDKKINLDACIVGEPSSQEQLGDSIKIGRRGSITFKIIVHGVQGHVAYPDMAQNPISKAIEILHALDNHPLDEGTEHFQPSNLEITSVDVGNSANNVIPQSAKLVFNIRFNDNHSSGTLIKWVEGLCESLVEEEDLKYEMEYRVSGEAFYTEPAEFVQTVCNAVQSVTGKAPELSTSGGTSDARFIKDFCPVLELGHMNTTMHKIDESIPVDDLERLKDIYKAVVVSYFKN